MTEHRQQATPPGDAADGWLPLDLATLIAALDLTRAEDAFYGRAAHPDWPIFPGSQILGSAVVALERSWPGFAVRSLQCLFMRSGRRDTPARFEVAELHRGKAFVTAEVTMSQDGLAAAKVLAVLASSVPAAVGHGPPVVPRADPHAVTLSGAVAIVPWTLGREGRSRPDTAPDMVATWSRCLDAPSDPTMQRALFAHMSETLPVAAGLERYAATRDGYFTAVLTHTMELHEPFDLTDWLLVEAASPYAGHGLMQATSRTSTRDGRLVASVLQSAVVRPLRRGARP